MIFYTIKRRFFDFFRSIKFAWQRAFRGYDDFAWWDLDLYIAKIAAPILLKMAERTPGYPPDLTEEEWGVILHKMHIAMALIAKDKISHDQKEELAIDEGVELFGRWFRHLWT